MKRGIVIFERDERYTESGKPELDFRLIRGILPSGSTPLAIANGNGFTVTCGQYFDTDQVRQFAEEQSGYTSA